MQSSRLDSADRNRLNDQGLPCEREQTQEQEFEAPQGVQPGMPHPCRQAEEPEHLPLPLVHAWPVRAQTVWTLESTRLERRLLLHAERDGGTLGKVSFREFGISGRRGETLVPQGELE